jgi:hypothetical protein
VKNGIKVLKYVGNEYTQGICMQIQGGDKIWVGNIYFPPIISQHKRGIDETVAKSLIEDTIGCFPAQETTVMCGDWNTRIANLAPKLDDINTTRLSADT